jgi:tRNA threonylcarbamoyladenosine biosynthesis protein TsaB
VSGSLVLAIDSAFGPLSAAVARGARILSAEERRTDLRAAEHLPGLVQGVIATAGVTLSQVDRVAVTLGPGGFTSLRSGLAFSKGLAFALGKPLLGFTTLHALALSAGAAETMPVVAVIDAKRDELFVQSFSATLAPLTPPRVAAVAEIAELLPAGAFRVCGSAAAMAAAAAPDRAVVVGHDLPSASAMALFAQHCDPAAYPAEAVYLRPADARPMASA